MPYYDDESVTHADLVDEARALMYEHHLIGLGPGHVVIEDWNWNCCDSCLEEIQKVRNGEEQLNGSQHGCSPEQLDAAEKFLKRVKHLHDNDLIIDG